MIYIKYKTIPRETTMMQKKDLLILSNLRKDARMSLTNMSKATHIPISTIFDRLRMHEVGLIKKHTSLIDFEKLGFNTRANVCIKVDKSKREELREHLSKHQNVNSVFKINNGYDFLAEVVFHNIKDLEEFMENLEERFNVTQTQVYYLIEDIKREEFMADPLLMDLIN